MLLDEQDGSRKETLLSVQKVSPSPKFTVICDYLFIVGINGDLFLVP